MVVKAPARGDVEIRIKQSQPAEGSGLACIDAGSAVWIPAFAEMTSGWIDLPLKIVIPANAGIQTFVPQPQNQPPNPQHHGLPLSRE